MSKDIKKALEHCIDNECVDCPNREELGSGEIVCRGRLLPQVLEYISDLEAQIAEMQKQLKEKEKYTYTGKEVGEIEQYYENLLAEKEKEIRKKVCDSCGREVLRVSKKLEKTHKKC